MKSGITTQYIHSETQDSIQLCSRTESYDHSILIKDLDSRCFSIIDQKTRLSMIGKELTYGVLTENTQEEWNEKVKRLEGDNRNIKERVFQLQDMMRDQKDSYQSKIRLKDIAQAQYISGMKNMYQRNTTLSEQNILYEKQLKSSLFRICQLQKQLQDSTSKSKTRMNKQMQLQLKIKHIQQKYHEKILSLQKNYDKEKTQRNNQGREWRFQIQNLKEEIQKYKRTKRQLETTCETMNKTLMDKQNKILQLNTVKVHNDNLIIEIKALKEEIMRVQKENQNIGEKHRQMEKLNIKEQQKVQKYQSQDHLTSSTIAALAIQNITLKHQNAQSSKNLHILSDKVRSYQTELYYKDIDKQNQHFQRSQSQQRNSFRKERYSSVQRKNTITMIDQPQHQHQLQHQSNFYSTNNLSLNQNYPRSSLRDHRRHRHQDSLNEILVKKCKQLNQSLYI